MNTLSIAPMIGWTDRHYRYLFRHITRCPTLYTEMVMDTAILYNLDKLDDFIGHNRELEHPLALQLGGNNPETLGKAVEACEQYGGFSEINLNCGCPSNKAKRCGFGAELMLEPDLVRQIVSEMNRRATSTEITVKCRIGTNTRDTWGQLLDFVHACRDGGVRRMIIHARICILCGLSPAQNRNIPPLRYDIVSRLVDVFPDMKFVLNGGVRTFDQIDSLLGYDAASGLYGGDTDERGERREQPMFYDLHEKLSVPLSSPRYLPTSVFTALPGPPTVFHLPGAETGAHSNSHEVLPTAQGWSPVHGVMVGREAYNNPWAFADADRYYYGKQNPGYTRSEVLDAYLAYAEGVLGSDAPRSSIPYLCKPLHNFFTGCPGNKFYKRKLDNLLKVHVAHTEKARGAHVVDTDVSFEQIVREAVVDTIPLEFLHSSACTFPPCFETHPPAAEER